MIRKVTSLEDDFKAIGVNKPTIMDAVEESLGMKRGTLLKEDSDSDDGDDNLEGENDVNVTLEDLQGIQDMDLDEVEEEEIDGIIAGLEEKVLPEDASDELVSAAKETVDRLFEVKATRIRRRKAGSASKAKSRQCPDGFKMVDGKCKKVGKGELTRNSRKKKKYAKTGTGKKSAKKSVRFSKRFEDLVSDGSLSLTEGSSPFARELHAIVEDSQNEASTTVRHEIMEHVSSILDMLNEEFRDDDVAQIFEDVFGSVVTAWDAGRLDEEVMEEDEFMGEIKPVLTMIHKSIDRIQKSDSGALKN